MRFQSAVGCALLLFAACAHDATSTQAGESASRARKVTPKTPPGQPPLAASPSELLQPGARQKLAEALRTRGFLDSNDAKGEQLSAGLRKFQESEGLAATGFPDHESLLRLGIDPKEVDRSLDDAGKGGSGNEGSAKKSPTRNATPPSDQTPKDGQKGSDPSNSGD
jgi:hypothetical protein